MLARPVCGSIKRVHALALLARWQAASLSNTNTYRDLLESHNWFCRSARPGMRKYGTYHMPTSESLRQTQPCSSCHPCDLGVFLTRTTPACPVSMIANGGGGLVHRQAGWIDCIVRYQSWRPASTYPNFLTWPRCAGEIVPDHSEPRSGT
ncbi:hypothetical protein F5Y15DRAFT_330248 [Xylariaceae sp. FL0016]|nr:hypothetical protein F5Y15DRAFT_330248 [Xylariaceae sp. FL0016]